MRKWKDNEVKLYSKTQKIIFELAAATLIIIGVGAMLNGEGLDSHVLMNIGGGLFVIWGVQFGGFYKIMRAYAEWKIKRNNPKFDYFHT